MRNIVIILVAAVVLLPGNLSAAEGTENFIQVRGTGEVKVDPDLVNLSIEVWSKEKDAKRAQESNAKEYARIDRVLKDKFKIDAKDIQSTQINLNPDYRYENNGKRILQGYLANHTVQVTFHEIAKLGNLLDGLTGEDSASVGTNIQGVVFGTDKKEQFERDALALAVKNSRERADIIAKAAGRSIKELRHISDSSSTWEGGPRPTPMMGRMETMSASLVDTASTQVSPGQIRISTQVLAEYNF